MNNRFSAVWTSFYRPLHKSTDLFIFLVFKHIQTKLRDTWEQRDYPKTKGQIQSLCSLLFYGKTILILCYHNNKRNIRALGKRLKGLSNRTHSFEGADSHSLNK